jgi:hypothetical protein
MERRYFHGPPMKGALKNKEIMEEMIRVLTLLFLILQLAVILRSN